MCRCRAVNTGLNISFSGHLEDKDALLESGMQHKLNGLTGGPWRQPSVTPPTYPSLSQSALQLGQLGGGTPGLGDQAFVGDGRAAEIKHHLHRLALLHAHLPLGQHGHRLHQHLLQEGLRLQHHLKFRGKCEWVETQCVATRVRVRRRLCKCSERSMTRTDLMSSILTASPCRISSRSAGLSG